MFRNACFTFLPVLLLSATSCSTAARSLKREAHDRAGLGEAVGEYWNGVRFNRVDKMSGFLLMADDQLAVARIASSPTLRITDTRVLQVAVDAELVDPKDRPSAVEVRREGAALVRVEWYGADQLLATETVEQRWFLDGRGWHVDVTRTPIDPDRPW